MTLVMQENRDKVVALNSVVGIRVTCNSNTYITYLYQMGAKHYTSLYLLLLVILYVNFNAIKWIAFSHAFVRALKHLTLKCAMKMPSVYTDMLECAMLTPVIFSKYILLRLYTTLFSIISQLQSEARV